MTKTAKAVPLAVLQLLAQWAMERCEQAKQTTTETAELPTEKRITMAIDTMTIAQFISENRISITSTRADYNPNMDDLSMDHWKCVLSRRFWEHGKRKITVKMTVAFSMGYGHHGKAPDVADVLNCLSSDSSLADDNSFEGFCSELGYDVDSRKAEKTFKACQHTAKRLQNFLGVGLYGQLLYSVEPL